MPEAMFAADGFTVRELVRAELPALQALFSAPGVWHIALFLLEDALHGSGIAARVLARPLGDETLASYLRKVPRDAPGSTLP